MQGLGGGVGIECLSPKTVLNGEPRKFWKLAGKRDIVHTIPGREEWGADVPLPSLGLSKGKQSQPLDSGAFDG